MKTTTIESTYGYAIINIDNGEIINIDTDLFNQYNISKFDVDEWSKNKNDTSHNWKISNGLTLSEIGYWNTTGKYFPADENVRKQLNIKS